MEDRTSFPVNAYVAEVDGSRCRTISSFLAELATAMKFPEYFGGNYNALWDCITDLQWLEEENYVVVVHHSEALLADEAKSERDHLLELFERVRSDWRNVPNYPGEEEYRKPADFRFILR